MNSIKNELSEKLYVPGKTKYISEISAQNPIRKHDFHP